MKEVTPEQASFFRDQGYLLLRCALKKQIVQPVKTHVLNELKRLKIWSGDRTLSDRIKGVPPFKQVTTLGQLINYPGLKYRLMSQSLVSAMHRLAGVSLVPEQEAQLLLSLPNQGDWTLEGLSWHRDISQSRLGQFPGIQAFILIDDVLPHGGATLALAASHRITGKSQGKQNDDIARAMKVGDIDLSILEMAGKAGDVYLMDMRVIHTPSINSTQHVRMMATIRYFAM